MQSSLLELSIVLSPTSAVCAYIPLQYAPTYRKAEFAQALTRGEHRSWPAGIGTITQQAVH